jgi:hypothetical protein
VRAEQKSWQVHINVLDSNILALRSSSTVDKPIRECTKSRKTTQKSVKMITNTTISHDFFIPFVIMGLTLNEMCFDEKLYREKDKCNVWVIKSFLDNKMFQKRFLQIIACHLSFCQWV